MISRAQRNRMILRHFKENVRCILECSNATPVRGHWGIGYACIYCSFQHPLPSNLKLHTLSAHSKNVDELNNVKYVSDMIIKIDVTELECKICGQRIDGLQSLMEHLKTIHEQQINLDINNHIVPFRFDTEFLQCSICAKQFDNFKNLSEHMNQHYRNYECLECGRHFINKRSLRTHKNRHQTGVFICAYCSKIFDTRIKMKEHERVLHLKGSKTRKCGYCEERFVDAVRKTDHEVKEHGAPIPQFECKACGKHYDSQRSLKAHTRHFHLLLRPHVCSDCGKGFYNKQEMKRHRVKHTKIKEFQCEICSKWYGTKSSLKGHMKTHEDNSYACERCGHVFDQKNSWIRHVKQHVENDTMAKSADKT